MAASKLIQLGAKYGARQLGIENDPRVQFGLAALNPVGSAIKFVSSKIEEQGGFPKGTVGLVTDPKGFVKGVVKGVAEKAAKDSIDDAAGKPRREIPEEDHSVVSKPPDKIPVEDRSIYSGGSRSGAGGGSQSGTKGNEEDLSAAAFKRGGKVKKMASGGMVPKVSSASKRADGIAKRGKTRGKLY